MASMDPRAGGSGTDFQMAPLRPQVEGQVRQRNRVWRQCAAPGRCIEGSCRGRGSETLDGVALRVCVQPLLPVRGANFAVRLVPSLQVVGGL